MCEYELFKKKYRPVIVSESIKVVQAALSCTEEKNTQYQNISRW